MRTKHLRINRSLLIYRQGLLSRLDRFQNVVHGTASSSWEYLWLYHHVGHDDPLHASSIVLEVLDVRAFRCEWSCWRAVVAKCRGFWDGSSLFSLRLESLWERNCRPSVQPWLLSRWVHLRLCGNSNTDNHSGLLPLVRNSVPTSIFGLAIDTVFLGTTPI